MVITIYFFISYFFLNYFISLINVHLLFKLLDYLNVKAQFDYSFKFLQNLIKIHYFHLFINYFSNFSFFQFKGSPGTCHIIHIF